MSHLPKWIKKLHYAQLQQAKHALQGQTRHTCHTLAQHTHDDARHALGRPCVHLCMSPHSRKRYTLPLALVARVTHA